MTGAFGRKVSRLSDTRPIYAKGSQMIRSELIKKLEGENLELKTEEIEKIVDLFFNQITQRLSDGGRVELRGFGAFSTRDRSPRKGRNPRTGASVDVPSKRVPYFKPGKDVRERLNKSA
jgi:integration host factor subunit beta